MNLRSIPNGGNLKIKSEMHNIRVKRTNNTFLFLLVSVSNIVCLPVTKQLCNAVLYFSKRRGKKL